jgi:hypothetical protein
LRADDLFAYLCVHGAVDGWFRLKWLADIGAILSRATGDEAERLYRMASARGGGRAPGQALLLCRSLFGIALPPALESELARDPILRWLEQVALRAMTQGGAEAEPPTFGAAEVALSRFVLDRGPRHWIGELRTRVFKRQDMAALPLPEWLHFLYFGLWPIFWLWKRFPRGRTKRSALLLP